MTKQNGAEQETLSVAMNRTETFFENNGKKLSYGLIIVLIIAAGIFGYRTLISAPHATKATEMISEAQYRFESQNPDYEMILNGDANGAGLLEIIDKYGSTPSGNLAKHYAGICYLHMGDFASAAKYLAQYDAVKGVPGAIVNAQNLGLQGDVAVEQQEYAKAVKFYEKAVKAAQNNLTAPMYLRKAGLAEMALGNNAKATEYFQTIITDYPSSYDAREAEKLIGATE